jgi:peptidoglycan hydrolase CwlO-like protein
VTNTSPKATREGVALASIQRLYRLVQEKDGQIRRLIGQKDEQIQRLIDDKDGQIQALQKQLQALEARVNSLRR